MKVKKTGDTYSFKVEKGETTKFLFSLSDNSAFGNPAKKPMKIRGNYRKCMKILLGNNLNELSIALRSGDYFEVGPPIFSRGRTEKDIEEYCGMYEKGTVKAEPPHIELSLIVPPGEAIKIYSIDSGFKTYLVNQGGIFYETDDYIAVEEATGVYF